MPRKPSSKDASSSKPLHASIPDLFSDPSLPLPALIVFDLDYTLWPFWVDTHVLPPLRPHSGSHSAATDAKGDTFAFYHDVPAILELLARHQKTKLGVASRTSAPSLARDLLGMLYLPSDDDDDESDGGMMTKKKKKKRAVDVFDAGLEIYPSSKMRHFEALHRRSGVVYEDMLFFDDESRNRETETLGVTMRLVRDGMTWDELAKGLDEWRSRRESRSQR
ncbi:hypothetical protein CDD81_5606 [Ophiocordyceps australis]|uniref:Magnesium-dependent phosphatase-1 n=1 Tax=Ophiocordyceps australis TaxID=1399860 RepID=A0A2C5Y2A2_9HYPO|nr:hypothetical protein CDD81_5606 [Ophiocordyceps australis]